MKVEGGCFCGAVRYEAEGDPILKGQCHCRQCQTIAGGAPNMFMAMPKAGFSFTKGQPKEFSRQGVSMPVTRAFCAECGTHLTGRVDAMPDAVFLKVGSLDDPAGQFVGPDLAIFMAEKQSYHLVPEGVATFERMPG